MAYDPRALILKAFELARERGKPPEMTVAVLKNRLIQLSHGEFNEANHGAQTFRAFLMQHQDLVRFDPAGKPVVSLASDTLLPSQAPTVRATGRVRRDLWYAVMDYSSGRRYVWSGSEAVSADAADTRPQLPTITEEELGRWRRAFVERNSGGLPPPELDQLLAWQGGKKPTSGLPRKLQGPWNVAMKQHVLGRLSEWFAKNECELPPDLESSLERAEGDEDIRAFVSACLENMSAQELESLMLPASALLRLHKKLSRG